MICLLLCYRRDFLSGTGGLHRALRGSTTDHEIIEHVHGSNPMSCCSDVRPLCFPCLVIGRAETIFQLEITPALDERLSEEARALRKKGITLTGIAQKLGLPKDKVSEMLGE